MNREQKNSEINELKLKFQKVQLAILTDYKGLKVNEINTLRRKLKGVNSELKVVKNRLAKIALKGMVDDGVLSYFVGTTAVTMTEADPVGPAKVLTEFAKDNEKVAFKVALMSGRTLNKKQIEALASLPSREELLAKMLGSMQAPIRNLASVFAQIPRRVVNVLAAIRDQKGK